MSNKKLFVLFLVPALLLFAGYGVWALSKSNDPAPESASQSTTGAPTQDGKPFPDPDSPVSSDTQQAYTPADVAEHNTANDCWTIIDGNVYDLTSYIPRHPGGDEILAACGTDGSSLFNQRQTSSGGSVGSGSPHSSNAASQLASLKIGTLVE